MTPPQAHFLEDLAAKGAFLVYEGTAPKVTVQPTGGVYHSATFYVARDRKWIRRDFGRSMTWVLSAIGRSDLGEYLYPATERLRGRQIDCFLSINEKPEHLPRVQIGLVARGLRRLVREAWARGEKVPWEVVMVSRRRLTKKEREKAAEIEAWLRAGSPAGAGERSADP